MAKLQYSKMIHFTFSFGLLGNSSLIQGTQSFGPSARAYDFFQLRLDAHMGSEACVLMVPWQKNLSFTEISNGRVGGMPRTEAAQILHVTSLEKTGNG